MSRSEGASPRGRARVNVGMMKMMSLRTFRVSLLGWALGALVVSGAWWAAPGAAQAQEQAAQAAPIQVRVRAIQAVPKGEGVDPALADLKESLVKGFEGYQGFKPLATLEASIQAEGAHTFEVPGGNTLQISHQGVSEGLIKLGVNVGGKFQTAVRVSRGNTFFQAGLPYEGGVLILAITVQ
jgi:hypothetical protein